MSNHLPTDYRKFIHTSRYARWVEEENRRETWGETVSRYMDNVVYDNGGPVYESDIGPEIEQAILGSEIMPSMRAMMTAGPAAERDNTCMYNCAYTAVDSIRAFDEAMFILLCGTGVGFSVERQFISKLPTIPEELIKSDNTLVVEDSKEGWAKALRKLIKCLYDGEVPSWDVSKVRPAGAKLKTFGGRASGPAPLVELFYFVVGVFQGARGRKLSSVECHDIMCKIGEVVVVGGVRRSAMISLSNLSDDRMRHAKSGNWWDTAGHRALANNSVSYTEKPDAMSFLREWTALAESGSGERGIFNRQASKVQAAKNGRRDPNHEWGTNPCCFSGDMKLLTDTGYKPFSELAKLDAVKIVNPNGVATEGKVWSSGVKPTVFVQFEGQLGKDSIQVTDDHVFMLADGRSEFAGNLKGCRLKFNYTPMVPVYKTHSFYAGFMLGDANLNRLNSDTHKGLEVYFHRTKDKEIADTWGAVETTEGKVVSYSRVNADIAKRYGLPAETIGNRGLPNTEPEFLQGLFSANGGVVKGSRVTLKTTDLVQVKLLKEALESYGMEPYITINKAKMNKFSNGEYLCKESYDLNIGRYDSLIKFAEMVNFGQTYKREALDELLKAKSPKVKSVVEGPEVEVFDFTEPETHWGVVEGVVVHNSEIILRPQQFCNLTEVVVRATDTFDDLKRKVRLATILGTIQSTYTKFPYLRKVWQDNTEEERLLGVSLTGIMDHPMLSGKDSAWIEVAHGEEFTSDEAKEFGGEGLGWCLHELKQVAIDTNKVWAEKLGIPQSTAITCVKPSGTVSQLVDSASGIHTRYSEYYIRTVRGDNKDPLTQFMIDQGIPYEACVMKPDTTTVFSFPMKSPEGAITTKDMTAIEQLEMWLTYQRHWCEHKPSVTISVRPDEWIDVGAFVYKHFDEMSGVSFLPYSEHTYQQAPYQEVSKKSYDEMVSKSPTSIDWSKLSDYETEDTSKGSSTFACVGGTCEIVDLT